MKNLVLLCALAGMPLLAIADDMNDGAMQGPGMQGGMGGMQEGGQGMQGQGMGKGGMGHGMGGKGGHRPPGPPPEFLTACLGKKEGDTVTVNTPRGVLEGSCRLMFQPARRPDGQGQQEGQQVQQGKRATPGQRPPVR